MVAMGIGLFACFRGENSENFVIWFMCVSVGVGWVDGCVLPISLMLYIYEMRVTICTILYELCE